MLKKVMLLLKQEELEELIIIAREHYFKKHEGQPKWLMYLIKRFYFVKYGEK
jgi:hypothetical protein